jgi:hypothetical protein
MIFGFISVFIGAIIAISSFLTDVSSAPQQTIQYLGFVCASIFISSGLIMISVKKSIEGMIIQNNYKPANSGEKAKWKCPKCNNENPNSIYQCGGCGYKLV